MRDRKIEGFIPHHFFSERKSGAGFTLIEIILVIALIGLLSSIVFASLSSAVEKGRISRAQADLSEFRQAIIFLEHDTGRGPGPLSADIDDLGSCTLSSNPANNEFSLNDSLSLSGLVSSNGASGWNGPYIPSIPKDPWGKDYYFDDDYLCVNGATGCSGFITGSEDDLRVIHSGGPNGSGINQYEETTGSDNVVLVLCVHP